MRIVSKIGCKSWGEFATAAQHLRDCRLLFNEFGYLPLQLGAGPNEVPHDSSSRQGFLVHAQPFVGSA